MSEQALETYNYVLPIFHNPYCRCELYEKKKCTYRVFLIQEDKILQELAQLLPNTNLDYSFYQGRLALILPWHETISLNDYQRKKHSWKETLELGKRLLFTLQEQHLPEALNQLSMDRYSIGVDEQLEPYLLQNPNFSQLIYQTPMCNSYQRCAVLLQELLDSSIEVHKHRYRHQPPAYLAFKKKVSLKFYHSNEQLMRDLIELSDCFEKKTKNYRRWFKVIMIVMILMIVCILLTAALKYYLEWLNRTYDGINQIGGRRIRS